VNKDQTCIWLRDSLFSCSTRRGSRRNIFYDSEYRHALTKLWASVGSIYAENIFLPCFCLLPFHHREARLFPNSLVPQKLPETNQFPHTVTYSISYSNTTHGTKNSCSPYVTPVLSSYPPSNNWSQNLNSSPGDNIFMLTWVQEAKNYSM